jgi:trigger factor
LRKQRARLPSVPRDLPLPEDDRVTVDFVGKIDGEPFDGGRAQDFQFVVGEGQMLQEFEEAVVGMKIGESKTFPLSFSRDYQGREVAGKTADFMVTLKKLEATHLPEVTE